MAPTPKHPSTRRNRSQLRGPDWVELPSHRYDGSRPRQPSGLRALAKAAWKAWWRSPMAHMWTEADHHLLVQTVRLLDQLDREWSKQASSEYRALCDSLGLNPDARRRLRWMLPGASLTDDGQPDDRGTDADELEERRRRRARVDATLDETVGEDH